MRVTIDLPAHIVAWMQAEAEAAAADDAAADRVRGIEPAPQEPRRIEQETALQIERAFQAAIASGRMPLDRLPPDDIPF